MAEKTEKPTEKRLEDARKKGQVAKSNDLTAAVAFLAAVVALFAGGKGAFRALQAAMEGAFTQAFGLSDRVFAGETPDFQPLTAAFLASVGTVRGVVLPPLAAAALAGLAAGLLQTRFLVSPAALAPKLDRLDAIKNLKNRFSKASMIQLVKSLAILAVMGIYLHGVLRSNLRDLPDLLTLPLWAGDGQPSGLAVLVRLLRGMLVPVSLFLLGLGAIDYGIQRQLHEKQLMMTKDEVKREYKESEGDPHVKGHRKQLHMELIASDLRAGVRRAKVVVVNPTHLAVALEYERGRTGAPQVTAKGVGETAGVIRKLAAEFRVPIRRDVPLARSLYALPLEAEIPEDLYAAVAAVLRWVDDEGRRS